LTRSFAARSSGLLAILAAALVTPAVTRDDAGDLIRRGKDQLSDGRVVAAESSFARAAAMARGDERREAWFLQAGVVRSGAQAEAIYRRVLDDAVADEWTLRSAVELAKIQFALGQYETARAVLREADACEATDEACLFEGLSCLMARHFEEAVAPLERIRKGRLKTWAAVALAEANEGAGRHDEACARYEALARSRVNPAAWYRYAECLESSDESERARREYEALEEAFPQTPEALRAAEKLAGPAADAGPAEAMTAEEAPAPTGPGYTIQFGSFGDRGNAIKLYAKIKRTHPGIRIDSELVNYREVFRVRYGHYATREEAKATGEAMARALDEQFTVMPVAPRSP
jgi:tetratricopeptide (TPR) repeat protein